MFILSVRERFLCKLIQTNPYQRLRFWCIYAFRCLPFFTRDLLDYFKDTAYFALFFSKIVTLYTESIFSQHDRIVMDRAEALQKRILETSDVNLFKLYPPIAKDRTHAFFLDLINDLYVWKPEWVYDIDNCLLAYFNNHSVEFLNILLDDIDNIGAGHPLQITNSIYEHDCKSHGSWENLISTLYDFDYVFFANCIERLIANGMILDEQDRKCIMDVPIEIYQNTSKEVSAYINGLIGGAVRINETRLILLGNKGSGKTSLARRLLDPNADMPRVEESTAGVDISNFKLKDICKFCDDSDNANVRVWDFAGHTITHAAHRCFLSERCVYIVLLEGRKENVNSLSYWLELVRNYGGKSKVFIVVNFFDQNIVRVDENRIRRDFYDNECEFFYFSILHDNNTKLLAFRDRLAQYLANNPAWNLNKINSKWFHVKEKIEQRFRNSNLDYISIEDYYEIAELDDINDKNDALGALCALGICLYYPQIDDLKTVVLNPEWITYGVYYIINWLVNIKRDYRIGLQEFKKVFSNSLQKYPLDKHPFLYKLMIYYELAYAEENNVLVIPQCMSSDEPEELPVFSKEYLQTRFEARNIDGCQIPFPPDLMPRIIVKCFQEMKNKESFAWRYGAVLHTKDSIALITQDGAVLNTKVCGKQATELNFQLYQIIDAVIKSYDSFQKNKPICSILPFLDNGERGEVTPVRIINHMAEVAQETYINPQDNQPLDMIRNARAYANIIFYKPVLINSIVINLNEYNESNYNLQGAISDFLSQLPPNSDVAEIKSELEDLKKSLEENEESKAPSQDAQKTGLINKLKRFGKNLLNFESVLNQTLRGMKNGQEMLVTLVTAYNFLASIFKLPEIPVPIQS